MVGNVVLVRVAKFNFMLLVALRFHSGRNTYYERASHIHTVNGTQIMQMEMFGGSARIILTDINP